MTETDRLREALRDLVNAAPDPAFVRKAALDDDSDPSSMIEEGARCYREALGEARALLSAPPPPAPDWMPGGARCTCGMVEFMVPAVPCVRVASLDWDGRDEIEDTLRRLRWMEHTPLRCEWVDLLPAPSPARSPETWECPAGTRLCPGTATTLRDDGTCSHCGLRARSPETEPRECPYCAHPVDLHAQRPIGCRVTGCICTHGEGVENFPEPHPAFAPPAPTPTPDKEKTVTDYDKSIHSNPDASAWAKFFVATMAKLNKPCPDEATMLGWFANAMMAMHDFHHPAPVRQGHGAKCRCGHDKGAHRPGSDADDWSCEECSCEWWSPVPAPEDKP